jgi:hypothetical protein
MQISRKRRVSAARVRGEGVAQQRLMYASLFRDAIKQWGGWNQRRQFLKYRGWDQPRRSWDRRRFGQSGLFLFHQLHNLERPNYLLC